jgi:hypothetical protein
MKRYFVVGFIVLVIVFILAFFFFGNNHVLNIFSKNESESFREDVASVSVDSASTTKKEERRETDKSIIVVKDKSSASSTQEETVTAYIASINDETITLDYFDLLEGKDAFEAKVADGVCTSESAIGWEQGLGSDCFTNGVVYFRNKNNMLHVFKLSPDVVIIRTSAFDRNAETGTAEVTVGDLQKLLEQSSEYPFLVTLDSNEVVARIEEIFRP